MGLVVEAGFRSRLRGRHPRLQKPARLRQPHVDLELVWRKSKALGEELGKVKAAYCTDACKFIEADALGVMFLDVVPRTGKPAVCGARV
jgi:hypothetical protein